MPIFSPFRHGELPAVVLCAHGSAEETDNPPPEPHSCILSQNFDHLWHIRCKPNSLAGRGSAEHCQTASTGDSVVWRTCAGFGLEVLRQ